MSDYGRHHCKLAVAKILQSIGWHSIGSFALDTLTDLMVKYIKQISKSANDYASEFGQTDPNLDHLGLAFQEAGVNLGELEEYVTFVNFVPAPELVPQFPIPRESNLNFLKPGSKEVLTRPVHIHEHLPPMYPLLEEQQESTLEDSQIKKENDDETGENQQFKKPVDALGPEYKRTKKEEEGSRPTREISSVMMTTSGFLSPACEGKLPEPKAPIPPAEPPKPPSPVPPVPELVSIKKKVEKKKEKVAKESVKTGDEKPPKKSHAPKEGKSKPSKASVTPSTTQLQGHFPWNVSHFAADLKMPPLAAAPLHKSPSTKSNFNKTLAAAKAKTEKLNTTITPIPIKSEAPSFPIPIHHQVDKLVTEPDKKKINILKKISNVKEKHEKPAKHHMSPQLIQQTREIVNKISMSSDITIEPIINPPIQRSPEKVDFFFDDGSPPGTPPTPKTPDILTHTHSPPLVIKERRKRKEKPDKPRVKKPRKQQQQQLPPPYFMEHAMDIPVEQPKPLEPPPPIRPSIPYLSLSNPRLGFPLPNFGGPGLIPHPLNTPIFPFSPMVQNLAEQGLFPPPKPEPAPRISPKPSEHIKQEPPEVAPPPPQPQLQPPLPLSIPSSTNAPSPPPIKVEDPVEEPPKKIKEHKKDKKDKIKKKNKKEKVKDKSEKKKLKEAKKEKEKKKKKVPKEEPVEVPSIPKIFLKVNSPSPRPETPDTMKKLNIKPIVKKEDASPERKRETSPGLAKISALVTGPPKPKNPSPVMPVEKTSSEPATATSTPRPPGRPRIHPLKPKPTPKVKKIQQPFTRKDAEGNIIWFCPECDLQDDGRPMIGCDGCDAWYHWVCVGIQVPPDNNENWYCRRCLAQKNADLSIKKKKRKKKNQG